MARWPATGRRPGRSSGTLASRSRSISRSSSRRPACSMVFWRKMWRGVPAYSLFAGRMAAVDAALEALRRLVFVRGAEDLGAIRLVKCDARSRLRNPELRGQIVAEILGAAARLAA